jgi:hypothetical protein
MGTLRRQAFFDGNQATTDRSQLLLDLAQVLVGGGTPLVERARDGATAAGDAGLGPLDQLVDGLGDLVERTLSPVAAALCRSDRRLNGPLDRVA